ncbi:hypothetical protein QM467_06135 [Rhodoblastus sp. 17X3]|uniref:hypothetical protein n=1 Tax=Rhodoblastus sp. 17X3 TaxID=3047026 RepID=UPI0024B84107|nr:hypothetical protein [Rhodoblastus sp. 17X3]MDI9847639.1 hypothetical protein [Rhodoblastus sp. 17X3]
MNEQLITFLKAALECSVYVSPLDPGLTGEELMLPERDAIEAVIAFVPKHFGAVQILHFNFGRSSKRSSRRNRDRINMIDADIRAHYPGVAR